MEESQNWDEEIKFAHGVTRKVLREVGALSELDDMQAVASLALCECRRRFDGSLGVSFKTFAYLRIRGAVLDELRKIHRRQRREPPSRSDRAATEEEGWSELDQAVSPLPTPYEHCEKTSMRQLLENLVSGLSANERDVIRLLYFSEHTPEEVGAVLGGRSKSWISRYHRDALLSLQLILRRGVSRQTIHSLHACGG